MTQRRCKGPVDGMEWIAERQQDKDRGARLLEWDELPDWQRDNEYVLSNYRPASFSLRTSFESLGAVHNETINIYSHVFGATLFFGLPYALYRLVPDRMAMAQMPDVVVFSTFFLGVAICFFLSCTFHTIANHSPRVNILGNQLDYLGIVVLMWGSTIPSVYFGFYCDLQLQRRYWAVVSILAMLCIITTFNSRFRHPNLRPYRAFMYTGLGFSALGFVIHGLLLYGWDIQNRRMSLDWMGLMTLLNMIGALAYAVRIPERLSPRKFDVYGNSHQILHVMVVFAGLAHMNGLLRAFDYAHSQNLPCPEN